MQDKQGNTALHLAARAGHSVMVRLLLTLGQAWSASPVALTAARNKLGQVPLHCAALAGCQQSTQALQDAGPGAVNATDKRGRSPAELATRRGYSVRLPTCTHAASYFTSQCYIVSIASLCSCAAAVGDGHAAMREEQRRQELA